MAAVPSAAAGPVANGRRLGVIDKDAQNRIETAIAAAELRSRAELVAVIAGRASDYRATGIALSTIGAFLAGIVVWAWVPWSDTSRVLLTEFATFIVLLAVLELTPLGDRLTPGHVLHTAAQRLARAIFLEQGLARTLERNAVMFFVSVAERHVEIIADEAIDAKVDQAQWQGIIDAFTDKVRTGALEAGYIEAIAALSKVLATHFPANGERVNAVSNRLIRL
ncbi:TPM domain-containing protein [Dongia rigui]|uniref:TPM domain-containing protein n=1 Tax=Dongia rigui TaxID=940149 RepID=A0ABU5E5G7_9PROT|nr:TPM domain-containing protein [Dongia rigui]MDY0874188.1 TPM domain-containing protein [Dongia rigui]